MYFAHGAVHAPLQAKPSDIEKYKGKYEEGWDQLRRKRFEKQRELGVIPSNTNLPSRNFEQGHAVKEWDALTKKRRNFCSLSGNIRWNG